MNESFNDLFSFQVLGREVYTSNAQLGGTQIMHNNGVTHLTASSDFEGVVSIVNWLSYLPKVSPHFEDLLSTSWQTFNLKRISLLSLATVALFC